MKKPVCQQIKDTRLDTKYRCQAALFDNSAKKILIVQEQTEDVFLRRWGLPKGHFKQGERTLDCIHREICEETGIDINDILHVHSDPINLNFSTTHIITFSKSADKIELYLGPEIRQAKWVDLFWLIDDIKEDIDVLKKIPKYNSSIKEFISLYFS